MAELADATVSNTVGEILTGSIPVQGTRNKGAVSKTDTAPFVMMGGCCQNASFFLV